MCAGRVLLLSGLAIVACLVEGLDKPGRVEKSKPGKLRVSWRSVVKRVAGRIFLDVLLASYLAPVVHNRWLIK